MSAPISQQMIVKLGFEEPSEEDRVTFRSSLPTTNRGLHVGTLTDQKPSKLYFFFSIFCM